MAELQTLPPPPEAVSAMLAIPQVQIAPTILATQQGPDGELGPEMAGAILILQATFADPEGARGFWAAAVPLMKLLASAPGFIRRYSFPDGPSITLIALWRTATDAVFRRDARTPRRRARPLQEPLAIQPLRRDLGDDLEPRAAHLLRPVRWDHRRVGASVQRLWGSDHRCLPSTRTCLHDGGRGSRFRVAPGDRTVPTGRACNPRPSRSEEHTSELQSRENLVCRLLLEQKK